MNNIKYVQEVVHNDKCIVCDDWIPIQGKYQKWRLYCSTECSRDFYRFRAKNGLLKYEINHYNTWAKKKGRKVHRY